jgi:hypothetical protein
LLHCFAFSAKFTTFAGKTMEKISITIELTPEQIQALLVNRTLTISASSLPGESREQVHDPDLGQATHDPLEPTP